MKESVYVSKFLRSNGFAENMIEIKSSQVTFEDHVELMNHHFEKLDEFDQTGNERAGSNADEEQKFGRFDDFFVIANEQYNREDGSDSPLHGHLKTKRRPPEYIVADMNKVVVGLDRELGWLWDKKKESFARRRLTAYLIEDRSSSSSKQSKSDNSKKKQEAPREGWLSDAY